jgi:sugar fermentation stimulation protein A
MFPDAVTSRGRKHVDEPENLSGGNTRGGILFLINAPEAEDFMPGYHTDPGFTAALEKAKDKITILPI